MDGGTMSICSGSTDAAPGDIEPVLQPSRKRPQYPYRGGSFWFRSVFALHGAGASS